MLNDTEEVLRDLKKGRMIIVVDDEERENEGDLVCPASTATPAHINFMATHGRGLICVPMEEERLSALELRPMLSDCNRPGAADPFKTAWTVSVDAAKGVTTGISAQDRARTIRLLADRKSRPEDFSRPGHVFPLMARKGGVLVRAGHTEATVDLMKMAGLPAAAVICEIMNPDGTMARQPQLKKFAARHGLKIYSIAQLIEHRRREERLIEKVGESVLPTEFGTFRLILYRDTPQGLVHSALVMGNPGGKGSTLVRVHSECFTGDVLHSLRCDCGNQLARAMQMINCRGEGVVLYMRQEGRGIGLVNKIKAYNLQDQGMDTVQANEALGFKADLRDYGIGAQILADLGLRRIELMTNNPRKIAGLEGYGLKVTKRVPIEIAPNPANLRYLKTKRDKLGHKLSIGG